MLPTVKLSAGSLVFKEGALDKTMFIVIEGSVRIYVDRNGVELELAVIDQYDFFGEMALYRNRPRSATARVLTDAKLVVIKNQTQLEQFIYENPRFAGKMMVIMGNRLANTNDLLIEKMGEISIKSAESSGDTPEIEGNELQIRIMKRG
jgi:CRP/FNR family cyclic AMP-dependent transcriptional regulator